MRGHARTPAAIGGGRLFYWDSPAAFADLAGQVFDLGYDEICVYYPVDAQRDVFEQVAADTMPAFRRR